MLPLVGLAGPLFAFALIALGGVHRDPAVAAQRPHGRRVGHGAAMSYPSLATHADRRQRRRRDLAAPAERLNWNDPRIRPWIVAGVVAGHAQAATLTCIGFFVIDRLHLAPHGLGRADRDRDDGRRGRRRSARNGG